MSKQLTRFEMAKVFSLYIGQCIKTIDGATITLTGVHCDDFSRIYNLIVLNGNQSMPIEIDKPSSNLVLSSLDKIKDEDAIKMYHLYCSKISKYDYTQDFGYTVDSARHWLVNGGVDEINEYACLIDYARSKGYDTKIYFTENHWANGKTASELNLAKIN